MNIILPKGYLSYSSFSLWKRDKERFRRKYYYGEKDIDTVETIFGKKIAERLEDGEKIDGVIVYKNPEHRMEVEYKGIKLMGYLDSFDPETLSIAEYKTGHANKDKKAPWDIVKVHKHEQLVFYSMLVFLKHKKYNKEIILQWLETDFSDKTIEFAGHVLTSQTRELKLTGRVETFKRKIYKYEITSLLKEIEKVAIEISTDYLNCIKK